MSFLDKILGKKKTPFEELGPLPPLPEMGAPPPPSPGLPAPPAVEAWERAELRPEEPGWPPPPGAPPAFTPEAPPRPAPPPKPAIEDIEEVAGALVDEKWEAFTKKLGEVEDWRKDASAEITGVKEQVRKLEKRLGNMETAIFGKIEEYSKGIEGVSAEIKALQRVFQNIMPAFTQNVKDLRQIVEKGKKK